MADIEITGELSFHMRSIDDNLSNARVKEHNTENITKGDNNVTIDIKTQHETGVGNNKSTTAAEGLRTGKKKINKRKPRDCLYQYPDEKLMEALHSDMMNQLTKIFVGATDYIVGRDERHRRHGKRFKVVNKKIESGFFEEAFNLMSEEYRQAINTTAEEIKYSNRDPCHHQAEVKQIWQNLLEQSKTILKKAALRCISDFLRVRNRTDDTRTKEKLGQLLLHEIKEVRSNQIKLLCDEFKLCYKDLLL